MGGGGFAMRDVLTPLDRFVLARTGKTRPKVCFVPTASGDPCGSLRRFHQIFGPLDCGLAYVDVFRQAVDDLESFLAEQDVVYVGGGNTRNMLLLWEAWGVDRALRFAYERGTLLAGVSAGALCWFQEGITDSYPGRLVPLRCLGLIDGSFSPHYDVEPGRRPAFEQYIACGELADGFSADDGAALLFEGGVLREAITEEPGKLAYRVSRTGDTAREEALPTRLLSA
jgi:dipeptidase E